MSNTLENNVLNWKKFNILRAAEQSEELPLYHTDSNEKNMVLVEVFELFLDDLTDLLNNTESGDAEMILQSDEVQHIIFELAHMKSYNMRREIFALIKPLRLHLEDVSEFEVNDDSTNPIEAAAKAALRIMLERLMNNTLKELHISLPDRPEDRAMLVARVKRDNRGLRVVNDPDDLFCNLVNEKEPILT